LVSAAEALAAIVRRHHAGIRARFPALRRDLTGRRRTYLNNAGGTFLCEDSVRSMSRIARRANAQDGTITPGERATARVHAAARRAVADFLNAPSPEEISFHQSASHALFNLSFAFRDSLRPGDNLVVTRLDHAANVTPWKSFWGEDRGLEIRECGVTRDGMLDLDHLARLVDRRTRIVAVTCASNGLGSVVPIEAIVRLARRHGTPRPGSRARGALVVVDAVHHACHAPLDVRMLGCDFLVFSGYKVFGPMGGVLWGRRRWLTALRPYRVEANADETPFKYEQGTPNHAVLAGITGAMEYLEWLGARIERDAARRPGLKPLYRELRRRTSGRCPSRCSTVSRVSPAAASACTASPIRTAWMNATRPSSSKSGGCRRKRSSGGSTSGVASRCRPATTTRSPCTVTCAAARRCAPRSHTTMASTPCGTS
jgi:selenocysteine lyase/cysteine desulfurase